MVRLKSDQGQLFYEFHLGDAVPDDHLVRKIDAALDLCLASQRTCTSLFAHGSPIDRSGADLRPYGMGRGQRGCPEVRFDARSSCPMDRAHKGPAFFAYLIDVKFGVIVDVEAFQLSVLV
jgi:hypothetical protein